MVREIVHSRIGKAYKKALKKIADERGLSLSATLRKAIYHYIDAHKHEIELSDAVQTTLDDRDAIEYSEDELFLVREQNKKMEAVYKRETFPIFMDNFIADIYVSNSKDMPDDKLKEKIKDALEVFRVRAEYYDMEDKLDIRQEEPLHYATRTLKSRSELEYSDKIE